MTDLFDAAARPKRGAVKEFVEDGEILLYHPARDEATTLNQSAAEVWQLCDGEVSLKEIADLLGTRYGVEGALLLEDVAAALVELHSRDLVELQ